MAFEAIVKKQITRLREPSLKCIDLVVAELSNVVRMVAEKVENTSKKNPCLLLFVIVNPLFIKSHFLFCLFYSYYVWWYLAFRDAC